jgi:hypothetical protein
VTDLTQFAEQFSCDEVNLTQIGKRERALNA